jgi:hypothetical protein
MKTPDLLKLRRLTFDAHELADGLLSDDATGPCEAIEVAVGVFGDAKLERCIDREGKRLAGPPSLPRGASGRGFSHYDPERLCHACRPYWFATMAVNTLEMLHKLERIRAREEGREIEASLSADRLRDLLDQDDAPLAEVLVDPDKYPEEVRARAREAARELFRVHCDKRDHHANVAALLDAVVRR